MHNAAVYKEALPNVKLDLESINRIAKLCGYKTNASAREHHEKNSKDDVSDGDFFF